MIHIDVLFVLLMVPQREVLANTLGRKPSVTKSGLPPSSRMTKATKLHSLFSCINCHIRAITTGGTPKTSQNNLRSLSFLFPNQWRPIVSDATFTNSRTKLASGNSNLFRDLFASGDILISAICLISSSVSYWMFIVLFTFAGVVVVVVVVSIMIMCFDYDVSELHVEASFISVPPPLF